MKKITIKAGRHSYLHLPALECAGYHIEKRIVVDESWLAHDNKPGWSKLWGFCYGHVHNSSYRFVIKVISEQIFIGHYSWIDRISPQLRLAQKGILAKVEVGDELYMQFLINPIQVTFVLTVNGRRYYTSVKRGLKYRWLPFKCFPYVGGDFVLDQDMVFEFLK